MWPHINREVVTVSLTQNDLTCSWITPVARSKRLMFKASKTIPLNHLEYEHSILFSPSYIGNQISAFLTTHSLQDAPVYLAVSGTQIVESLIDLPMSSPTYTDFPFPKLQTLLWDYRYLYAQENACYSFYVCGIPRQLLFQYKLLAITQSFNVVAVTTHRMALFHLYRYIKGPTFRSAQLAQDMRAHGHELAGFFSRDMLRRTVNIAPRVSWQHEHERHLAVALGLAIMGEE